MRRYSQPNIRFAKNGECTAGLVCAIAIPMNQPSRDLRERAVVTTDGSSEVGRATAPAFARDGCRLVVTARGPGFYLQSQEGSNNAARRTVVGARRVGRSG